MFQTIKRILGIGSADLIGGQSTLDVTARRLTAMAAPKQFAPASRLDAATIEGVQPDGSVWEFWRTDRATGEKWYRRVSDTSGAPDVHAIAADDDFEIPDYSPPFEIIDGEKVFDAATALRNARARLARRQLADRESYLAGLDDETEGAADDE